MKPPSGPKEAGGRDRSGRLSRPSSPPPAAAPFPRGAAPADCAILAAGASTRMGRPKLHLPLGGKTVLGLAIEAALAAGLRVVVVGRAEDPLLESYAIEGRVVVARNPDPERGMLSTLREALVHLEAESFFFMPGDMPFVSPLTFTLLLERARGAAAIPTCGGRRGHPVLLPSRLAPAIIGLGEGAKLRDFLESAAPLFVETDDRGILRDIDLPEDYRLALDAVGPAEAAS